MSHEKSRPSKNVRVHRPERTQIEMHLASLEQLLPADHRARVVWQYVKSVDTESLYKKFQPTALGKGRPAIAPEILLALWLLATIDSISSAREVERRCETDIPYMWLRGGVSVNYHTLSDFRSDNAEFFEKMLVDSVTSMIDQGFVTLETIGQDGMRVRASAGNSSFRRKERLQQLHAAAKQHVARLREESEDDSKGGQASAGRQSAAKRASEERAERIRRSLEEVDKLAEQKEKRQKGDGDKARCSTTDPEARRMKMGDGGFRPAYDFQFVTDGDARMIVHVDVNNSGSDRGKMAPLHQQVVDQYKVIPQRQLVDSAFATRGDVATLEKAGTAVFSTIKGEKKMKSEGQDPYAPDPRDSAGYAKFRERMSHSASQQIYKRRPSIAEYPNAECRNRGCRLLRVRGLRRVKSVALLYASTFNLLRMMNLGVTFARS